MKNCVKWGCIDIVKYFISTNINNYKDSDLLMHPVILNVLILIHLFFILQLKQVILILLNFYYHLKISIKLIQFSILIFYYMSLVYDACKTDNLELVKTLVSLNKFDLNMKDIC